MGTYLSVLGIAGLALTKRVLVGETDAEHTEQVVVSGLHIDVGLHKSLPFLDHPSFKKRTRSRNFKTQNVT